MRRRTASRGRIVMRSWSGLLVHVTMVGALVAAAATTARGGRSRDRAGTEAVHRVLRLVSRRRRQGRRTVGRCEAGPGSDADRQEERRQVSLLRGHAARSAAARRPARTRTPRCPALHQAARRRQDAVVGTDLRASRKGRRRSICSCRPPARSC